MAVSLQASRRMCGLRDTLFLNVAPLFKEKWDSRAFALTLNVCDLFWLHRPGSRAQTLHRLSPSRFFSDSTHPNHRSEVIDSGFIPPAVRAGAYPDVWGQSIFSDIARKADGAAPFSDQRIDIVVAPLPEINSPAAELPLCNIDDRVVQALQRN